MTTADWQKEKAAEAARKARKARATAEDIIERMRDLQTGLSSMGRIGDMMAVEQAVEIMERVIRGYSE